MKSPEWTCQLVHRDRIWIREHFAWLDRNFPGYLAGRHLVLPSPTFFPRAPAGADVEARANWYFEITKRLMGLSELPTRLESYDDASERTNAGMPALVKIMGDSSAAGLFRWAPNMKAAVIQYRRGLVADIEALVATFAHELCHYLLCYAKDDPPAGWKDLEPITDLTAVFCGFGLFLLNGCVKFSQYTNSQAQGWSLSTQGYLGSPALGSGLAMFLLAKGIDPAHVGEYLGKNGKHDLKEALASLTHSSYADEVRRLRASGLGDKDPQLIPSLKKPFWKELKEVLFGGKNPAAG